MTEQNQLNREKLAYSDDVYNKKRVSQYDNIKNNPLFIIWL